MYGMNSNQSEEGGEIKERASGEERDSWVAGINDERMKIKALAIGMLLCATGWMGQWNCGAVVLGEV
jgi:hypothetical protein